jgi:Family of unknown function (DUF6932)
LIPPFDSETGALPPGDHQATLEEVAARLGFTPRRRWLLKGLRAAVEALWAAGVAQIFVDGSFCTEKPEPGDIDGYWVEPDDGVYERIDPFGSTSNSCRCSTLECGNGACGRTTA